MGNAEDIKGLGEEMASSYENRVGRIATLAKETAALLKGFEKENKEREKMVSELLAGFREEEKAMAEELKSTLSRNEADRVKEAQAEIRVRIGAVGNLLKGFHTAHEEMSATLKKTLADNEAKRVKETQAEIKKRVADVRALLDDFWEERGKLASAWQNLVSLMEKTRAGKKVRPAVVKEEVKEEKPKEEETLREQVSTVIEKHPEGIKLSEIGEALGRDWRGLIPITKELIDENEIRKEENLYYPAS